MTGNKFKGLGKGLSALMGDIPQENAQIKNSPEKIPIHFVYANPSQPRKNFNQDLLNELSESIKEQGCLLYTSPSPRDRTRSRMPSSA